MDRGKNLPAKASKSKPLGFPGDFIALGSKSGRPAESGDVKVKTTVSSSAATAVKSSSSTLPSSSGSSDRKRENPSGSVALAAVSAKKPKPGLSGAGALTALGRPTPKSADINASSNLNRPEPWEEVAIEVEAIEILNAIEEAEGNEDEEKIEAILCGAVKQIKAACLTQRTKVDPVLTLALLYLAKWRPHYFNTEMIVEALIVLLKRDMTGVLGPYKSKMVTAAASLACNLLLSAFQDERNWPESFIKIFIEDSVGDRIWVDREECQGFVENILTAFNTKIPPKNILQQEGGNLGPSGTTAASSSPNVAAMLGVDEEASIDSDISQGASRGSTHSEQQFPILPRYQGVMETAESLVLDVAKEQISRRQQPVTDVITRNFLKFLASTAGIPEIRVLAAQRLELWISNPKLSRPAADLLLSICVNCSTTCPTDTDVFNALIRLRLKTKPLVQMYLTCLKELVEQQPDQLPILLRVLIFNELSQQQLRGLNNMPVLGVLVQHWPERTASFLADIFVELLLNRDDYLRALRGLLREMVRNLRQDLPLTAFCSSLLQATLREHREQIIRDFEFKDRLMTSLMDLTTLCIFLAVSPSVRESASLVARGDLREMELLKQFQGQATAMQRESVKWLYKAVPLLFRPNRAEYVHCLHKVLFMEAMEQYYNKDGWPNEVDRSILLRLSSEIPVLEDTLLKILQIGLSKDHPLSAPDALELCDQLLRRCAAAPHQGLAMLQAQKQDIFDMMLSLTAYHHPENIVLPQGYNPPELAISNLYWKAWLMLLLLTAHNPNSFGPAAWEQYPTLRSLMEMCITNNYTTSGGSLSEQQELQLAAMEKQTILEFETHLAAASTKITITESNSLLLSQLTSLNPRGPARRPPLPVLEQLRASNATLRLGHLLCRSRNPDFLLDILHRQGPAQSMPWLADLVESNEGAWSLLPVQCLCEFLLHQAAEEISAAQLSGADAMDDSGNKLTKRKERRHKQQQLIQHLGLLLKDPNQTPDSCREVLDYLMRRLGAQQALARQQAAAGLGLVLSIKEEDGGLGEVTKAEGTPKETEYSWLLHQLPAIAHFQAARPAVVAALRTALQMETQPRAVASYIKFLATHALEDPLQDLADLTFDLAQLIVERSSLVSALLPSPSNRKRGAKTLECLIMLFWHYIQKAREPNKDAYSWSENQDQVLVQWQSGEAATLHILVVHAMIILLTYGAPEFDEPQPSCFYNLLEVWFPPNGEVPQAFLVETSEEALIYPDWLKLRMIRSNVEALVDGALKDLEPGQLILFIQSFGIPVTSISKLLQALDRMAQANPFAFVEVDMDKVYMQQLLQVQWKRGARGGAQFADIMQLNEPEAQVVLERKDAPMISRPSLNLTQSVTGSLTTAPPLQPEYVASVLLKLFDAGTVLRFSQQEKMDAYRMLTKMLAAEVRSPSKPSIEAAASAFDGLLNGPSMMPNESEMLLLAMERQPSFSCGLLRLLTSAVSSSGPSPLLSVVLRICLKMTDRNRAPDACSPLRNIAKSFVDRHGGPMKPTGTTEQQRLDLSSSRLEKHVHQLSANALKSNDTRSLVSSLVNSLNDSHKGDRFVGLLIDWLELMDPEIITVHPDLQQNLLFGQSVASSSPTCRPYLLSLLIHRASWTTLRQCIHQLLGCRADSDIYQPSVVLDFLSASIQVPKLWQGRDKHVPKHQKTEDLLCLNQQQLTRLAIYIMSEYEQLATSNENPNVQQILENRSHLLLSCCGRSTKVEILLARSVAKEMETGRSEARKKAAQHLILQLYVRAPHIATRLPDIISAVEMNSVALTSVPCAMDSMLLTLISSLAAPQPGKDGTRRMADLETAVRKIAATHPLLLLRQFPSLAAALRGRAHLDLYVLRSRNHLSLFSCVLGLAHKLKTHLFSSEHRAAFEDVLDSFWTLFDYQRSSKELYTLIQQYIQLLLNYVASSPFAATHYLQKYAPLLQELQVIHPEMQAIKELRSALSLPRPADYEGEGHSALTPLANRDGIRLGPILARLRQSDNHEEVVQVLQDLENVCSRAACAPLDDALDDLRPLMSSPNTMVRNMTYSLLLRYLGDQPNGAADLLPDYLDCLDNPNAAVVSTALQRLPDFLLLCQESGSVLLQKAFSLAVESGFNTLPNLSEALMLLQLQSGT